MIKIDPSQVLALRDKFLKELGKAQKERKNREDWVEYERAIMAALIMEERLKLGLPPIDHSCIFSAENLALGHYDYSSKFSLYCAELVYYGRTGNRGPLYD